MDWQAIGALGELVGGIAVIGTLIYLAMQVRQHTRAIHSSTFQTTTDALNRINLAIASDPDLVRVVSSRPQSLGELTPEDRYRYSYVLLSLFRVRETAYYQQHAGTTAKQSWVREEITMRNNLESPAAREWWKTLGYGFAPEFANLVNNLIADIEKESKSA